MTRRRHQFHHHFIILSVDQPPQQQHSRARSEPAKQTNKQFNQMSDFKRQQPRPGALIMSN